MSDFQVAILMGSKNDRSYFKAAIDVFKDFDIPCEIRVLSAHRTPLELVEYVKQAESNGVRVFIGAAGGAAHLAGAIAAHTVKPVIGVPLPSSSLGGLDALLATVQMPGGIPVATVSIGEWGAKNGALLAIQMLSLGQPDLVEKLEGYRQQMRKKLLADS